MRAHASSFSNRVAAGHESLITPGLYRDRGEGRRTTAGGGEAGEDAVATAIAAAAAIGLPIAHVEPLGFS